MPEHDCKYEVDLALISNAQLRMMEDIKSIKNSVVGNGKIGLKTRVELLEQQHKLLPSVKSLVFYATIGGSASVLIAIFGKWTFKAIAG